MYPRIVTHIMSCKTCFPRLSVLKQESRICVHAKHCAKYTNHTQACTCDAYDPILRPKIGDAKLDAGVCPVVHKTRHESTCPRAKNPTAKDCSCCVYAQDLGLTKVVLIPTGRAKAPFILPAVKHHEAGCPRAIDPTAKDCGCCVVAGKLGRVAHF